MHVNKDEIKEIYSRIKYIEAPAFCNEKVYFNKHGLLHLIRKGRKFRSELEVARRLTLFQHVYTVLRLTDKISEYRKTTQGQSIAHFWGIKRTIDDIKIKVVVRQLNSGRKHFFSIVDE